MQRSNDPPPRRSEDIVREQFDKERGFLFKLAYRITGSPTDADEVVQDTFVRLVEHSPDDLESSLRPWLCRVATRLAVDVLRARKRRSYVGAWLPGVVSTEALADGADPEARLLQLETLTLSFLVAMESMRSTQRAVFVLRDVLDLSVDETAQALAISVANVKTSLHRARACLEVDRHLLRERDSSALSRQRAALQRVLAAIATGSVSEIAQTLRDDVVLVADGGGEFLSARKPVAGARLVATFLSKTSRIAVQAGAELSLLSVNHHDAVQVKLVSAKPRIAPRTVLVPVTDCSAMISRMFLFSATEKLRRV